MLGNQLGALNLSPFQAEKAYAQAPNPAPITLPTPPSADERKLGLVAILVDGRVLDDRRSYTSGTKNPDGSLSNSRTARLDEFILEYAHNVQNRIPHSKSIVVAVDPQESPVTIATFLEKLYYEGGDLELFDDSAANDDLIPEEDNALAGIVLVGNVPLPIVQETDGSRHPSLYPYTDFYRKRYIYKHPLDSFVPNEDVAKPTPEIWHGVITPPTQNEKTAHQQLADFFYKNNEYSNGNPDFADFEKRMLLANFPLMEERLNALDYNNYLRWIRYGEELVFRRFNKHLLKFMIAEVTAEQNPDVPPEELEPLIPDTAIDNMFDSHTEFFFNKYATPFSGVIKIYLGKLHEEIVKTGRWLEETLDTPGKLITLRDQYANSYIHQKQLELEGRVDDLIDQVVRDEDRKIQVLKDVTLSFDIKGIPGGGSTFTFHGMLAGNRIDTFVNSAEQCDIYLGSRPEDDQTPLENNSVLGVANRMFNPETIIRPPDDADDWKLKESSVYRRWAGCVYNNADYIEIKNDTLGPENCHPEGTLLPLYDILGFREIPADEPYPEPCSLETINFQLSQGSDYGDTAVGYLNFGQDLKDAINALYNKLKEDGRIIQPESNSRLSSENSTTPGSVRNRKAARVIRALLDLNRAYSYNPAPGIEVEVKISPTYKRIDDTVHHVEPTWQNFQAIKSSMATRSIPADGIRYVEFLGASQKERFDYLNFFRIEGDNPDEIQQDLFDRAQAKDLELSQKLGRDTTIHQQFLLEYSQEPHLILEPLIWQKLSIDQKLAAIIPKYVDRDSFLSLPQPIAGGLSAYPPKNLRIQPEVFHLVAEGDPQGYQFGLNGAMEEQQNATDPELELMRLKNKKIRDKRTDRRDREEGEYESEYICGDPEGVEIWEWFDALTCWIEEEVLPATDLFSLDNSCGQADLPAAEEEEEEEEYVDPIDDTSNELAQVQVSMPEQSLVKGQSVLLRIYPLNANGATIFGYVEEPVEIQLSNPDVGEVDKNNFHIFKGEEEVKFTAKENGSTNLAVRMGEFSQSITVNVYDSITVDLSNEDLTQGSDVQFRITATLRDPNGQRITNINKVLPLTPLNPAHGEFEGGGIVVIKDGQGTINFKPSIGPEKIGLAANASPYTASTHFIFPLPAPPVQLLIEQPRYIPIDSNVRLSVKAVNSLGDRVSSFNDSVEVRVTEMSKDVAQLLTPTVQLRNGQGTIRLRTGKETGRLNLIAEYPDLESGLAELPVLVRVDSGDWKGRYPESLFVSFAGFPGADLLQQDYLGGTLLFEGKTEAVYGPMTGSTPPPLVTIQPNYQIKLGSPTFRAIPQARGDVINIRVLDYKSRRSIAGLNLPLQFQSVRLREGDEPPEENIAEFELLNPNFKANNTNGEITVRDLKDNIIMTFRRDHLEVQWPYRLIYNEQPEFGVPELILSDSMAEFGRLILPVTPTALRPESIELNSAFAAMRSFAGKSTADPNALMIYDPNASVETEELDPYYGLQGENKYLTLVGGGAPVGEAVRFHMPGDAILLGDPTIALTTKSQSALNYDPTIGRKIFQDPEGAQIASITSFNFNRDAYPDIALVMQDGRVRLMQGGPTDPIFRDRGDIAYLADGAVALESFDFANDGYEDLLVATEEGRLAILHNERERLNRTNQKLKIGKRLERMIKGDMDADGFPDLVVLDSRGDIRIFYNKDGKISENGKLVANYGFTLSEDDLAPDLHARYTGLNPPSDGGGAAAFNSGRTMPSFVTPPDSVGDAVRTFLEEGGASDLPESQRSNFFEERASEAEQFRDNPASAVTDEPFMLPWPEGDESETYFASPADLGITVHKTVVNLDRPNEQNVDLDEKLLYTIEVTANRDINGVVFADTVPDSLAVDEKSPKCEGTGCGEMESELLSTQLFFSGLNLRAGQPVYLTYEVSVKHIPVAGMFVSRLENPEVPNDQYLDIIVSPPFNSTPYLIQHYSTAARRYDQRPTSDDAESPAGKLIGDAFDTNNAIIEVLEGLMNQDFDEDNPPDLDNIQTALSRAGGGSDPVGVAQKELTDSGCEPNYSVECMDQGLDSAIAALEEFSCMGGGCFPLPWNYTFLVPPQMNLPLLFAFPTTMPTPVGPIPFLWPPMPLGMSNMIPGPILSQFRISMGISMTGGMGISMCWGADQSQAPAPPPAVPIPYPSGNCMVTALPPDALPWGKVCELLEDSMNWVMEQINSGINKVNNAASAANNNPGIPAQFTKTNPSGGTAGGLEVELGVRLGEANKFNPPVKGFSNKHIPSMDSIMGAISGWVDRQTQEIINKLFTLPTFYVYLPDIKSIFSMEASQTKKMWDIFVENLTNSTGSTTGAMDRIDQLKESDEITSQQANLQKLDAAMIQGHAYLNIPEQLYAVANSLPIVEITEQSIDFAVPWLSPGEIQAYIKTLQAAAVHYKREFDRVKDRWAQYTCENLDRDIDPSDPNYKSQIAKNKGQCLLKHIGDMLIVNFDDLLESIQQNIQVLQSYLAYPKKIVKFRQQLVDYIRGVACYLEVIANMLGGWLSEFHDGLVSWAELIATIIAIKDNIEKLFDLFIDFDSNCSICTNERFANFGYWQLLGLIIPDIPIITFPKWPDIELDFSDFDSKVKITLPLLQIRPLPLELPPIPLLTLPDIPSISFGLQIPPLPILPSLPEFPELPPLPPIPTIDLPTLPPPPKLPDIPALEYIVPLVEKVLQIWCLVKKAMTPVPESMVNDQLTLLTNRPMYLIPLDMLKLEFPTPAGFDLGFNTLIVRTIIYFGVRIDLISAALESAAETWNKWIETAMDAPQEYVYKYIEEFEKRAQEEIDKVEEKIDQTFQELEEMCLERDEDGNCISSIQSEMEDAMEKGDRALRDAESVMQDAYDRFASRAGLSEESYEEFMQNYANAIGKANQNISDAYAKAREQVRLFFKEYGPWTQWQNRLEEWGVSLTPEDLQDLLDQYGREEIEKSAGDAVGTQHISFQAETPAPDKQITEIQTFNALLADIQQTVQKINNAEPVDYRVLKERFNVPDAELGGEFNMAEKVEWMRRELVSFSDEMEKEVIAQANANDLTALAGVAPRPQTANILVSKEYAPDVETEEKRVFTSAVVPKTIDATLEKKEELEVATERRVAANGSNSSPEPTVCTGVCLTDPAGNNVSVMPFVENRTFSETLVIPSQASGQNHIVISDGSDLYLKRNIIVPEDPKNQAPPVQSIILTLNDDLLAKLGQVPLREAINMTKVTITQDGGASFIWDNVTNPNFYGIGIELERSILGFDVSEQNNGHPDTKIVLLPATREGRAPEVIVNGRPIDYGTLVTSLGTEEAARTKFGVEPDTVITGATKIQFPTLGGATITLNDDTAVFFDQYESSAYDIKMENGYYHIRMTWFDEFARVATYNHNELIAPQVYAATGEPIPIPDENVYTVPIFKSKTIRASDMLVNLGGFKFYWFDENNNPLMSGPSDVWTMGAKEEPQELNFKLIATRDIEDEKAERFEEEFKVIVYVPPIKIDSVEAESTSAGQRGVITGSLLPVLKGELTNDDLMEIPFSLFRKRAGVWKNLGLLNAQKPKDDQSIPPLGERVPNVECPDDDSYCARDTEGQYQIANLNMDDPSPVVIKGPDGQQVAKVEPGTGRITLADPEAYFLEAQPATVTLPTRITIIEKASEMIVANVYYVPDSNTDVVIRESELTLQNVETLGVTVGDANPSDDFIAKNIPGYAPTYPGGVAIYNQTPPQKNIALIETDGSIRMMQAGYRLSIKNEEAEGERYIFQIVTDEGEPVFDVYIHADFDSINIKPDTLMNEREVRIGLKPVVAQMVAQMVAPVEDSMIAQINNPPLEPQSSPEANGEPPLDNPFPDLDPNHPYYQQILDLYKERVVSGYGDGTFRPDAKLSRAEFVKIALGVTGCYDCTEPTPPQIEKYRPLAPFPDVKLPAWYYYCISIAKDLTMVTGYGDGFFRPNQNISRAEAAAILLRQSGIELTEAPEEAFADVPDYAWYVDYVYTAVEIGLIKQNAGFVFPDEQITRGEFAFMAMGVKDMTNCRIVDSDGDGLPDWWEMENGLDPLFAGDAATDADFDGLTALQEYERDTSPESKDTDGDGVPDAEDEYTPREPEEPEITEPAICPCADHPDRTDTDGDGIIDVCDEDIDNDGVTNAICIFDLKELIDASEDNCIFVENTNQLDEDTSGFGDVCEETALCPCINNPNQNDTDGDGIIDVCDEDIDNDGILNAICLFDDSGLVDPDKKEASDDNCIFVENTDQVDSDINTVGDLCEPEDVCPPVPEDLDGVDDDDGCPELDDEIPDEEPGIYVTYGPACNFMDYEADLMDGDILMTAITDVDTHETVFTSSNEVPFKP